METRIILIVGSILLSCGCLGMILARLTNPVLKGLGWLGGAFAAGAAGAATIAFGSDRMTDGSVLAADTLILLGLVLLTTCILQLTANISIFPQFGFLLLLFHSLAFAVFHHIHRVQPLSVISLGIFAAASALQTVVILKQTIKPGVRASAWFTIVILSIFAAFNVFRSVTILLLGPSQDPNAPNPYQLLSAIVFLGTALGIGFAVFWMASSQIRVTLEQMANTDPLTGVHNRRSFLADCEKEILRSSRSGLPFSLIMIDIDHFKPINDRFGHSMGDAVLRKVVETLCDEVRNIDIVGRWGGEEFVALLPEADTEAAFAVAQRLRSRVELLNLTRPPSRIESAISPNTPIRVTISLGIATYLGATDCIESLLKRCDRAVYKAKAAGRNCVA